MCLTHNNDNDANFERVLSSTNRQHPPTKTNVAATNQPTTALSSINSGGEAMLNIISHRGSSNRHGRHRVHSREGHHVVVHRLDGSPAKCLTSSRIAVGGSILQQAGSSDSHLRVCYVVHKHGRADATHQGHTLQAVACACHVIKTLLE